MARLLPEAGGALHKEVLALALSIDHGLHLLAHAQGVGVARPPRAGVILLLRGWLSLNEGWGLRIEDWNNTFT